MGNFLNDKDGVNTPEVTETTKPAAGGSSGIYVTPEKPLSLENVDSDLFSAILAGEVDFVRSRFRGNDKMSDAEAVLMIRTRRAEEEKSYSQHVAAEAYAEAQQDPSKKPGAYSFFGGMSYEAYMRNQSRPENGNNRAGEPIRDLFGGFIMAGAYIDAFGGKYDTFGYEYANGNFRTAKGDFYDKAKGIITLATGDIFALPAGMENDGVPVMKMAMNIADIVDQEFAAQSNMSNPQSLAGKLLSSAAKLIDAGASIAPVAHVLEAVAPAAAVTTMGSDAVAVATDTPVAGVGANKDMALATASSAAAFAVAATSKSNGMASAMDNAFDEAFRASASFEAGGAVDRLPKHADLKKEHLHMAARFRWENIQAGMNDEEASNLTHKQVKQIKAAVHGHTNGVVASLLNNNMMSVSPIVVLQNARDSFIDSAQLKELAGMAVGAPKAGSVALNLGKKPTFGM